MDLATKELRQQQAVQALNELSNPFIGWRVDAEALGEQPAWEKCPNDSDDGDGIVAFPIEPHGTPGPVLCLPCALRYAEGMMEPNTTLSLDVLR